MASDRFDRISRGSLSLCAIVVTALLVRREFFPRQSARTEPPVLVATWPTLAQGRNHLGDAAAEGKIVVFSDFECPFCGQFARSMDSVLERDPKAARVYFKNFPLISIHQAAMGAAVAAECAASQGVFEAMHDFIFAHQDSIRSLNWEHVARRLGVRDTSAYASCLSDDATERRIREDSANAKGIGLTGTPTVIVNGWKLPGTPSAAEIRVALRKQFPRAK